MNQATPYYSEAVLAEGYQADAEARSTAQRELRVPIALEAGAGTGKTATLVARVLAWCLVPAWNRHRLQPTGAPREDGDIAATVLERVVAITFTDKAAAEMAERVASALAELEQGSLPLGLDPLPLAAEELRQRARHLLASLDRLRVQTIHSFCRSILGSYPLDAGLHPAFAVDADETATRRIAEGVLVEALPQLLDSPDGPAAVLLSCGCSPDAWLECLTQLALRSVDPTWLASDPFEEGALRAWLDRFVEASDAFIEAARGIDTGGGQIKSARELLKVVREMQVAAGDPGTSALVALGTLRSGLSDKALERLSAWAKSDFTASEDKALEDREAARAASSHLASIALGLAASAPELSAALRMLEPLYREVVTRMDARGVVTFDGLLARTRKLLDTEPAVRSALRRGIDQLLVDEFQDTDPEQCGIVTRLALEGPAHERPGLFVVGDPKQSIYGWRRADLAAYQGFVAELTRQGGRKMSLVVNYRSVPAILAEVRAALGPIMGTQTTALSPAFEDLLPSPHLRDARPAHGPGRAAVEHWCAHALPEDEALEQKVSSGLAREREARAIAADLAELRLAERLHGKDVALLFRTTSAAGVYLDALREAGVPYTVESDADFYQRREIVDATSLVSAILDPTDQVALLAWMRSPAVGVPDAAWIPLWKRGFPALAAKLGGSRDTDTCTALEQILNEAARELPAEVPGALTIAGWHHGAATALRALGALRRAAQSEPADTFVELLRERTWAEVTEASRYLGAHRLANLERFYRALERALVHGHANVGDLLSELRERLKSDDRDSGAPTPQEPGAVRVMTIHKSKGLAFHHVYLVNIHGQARREDDAPAFRIGATAHGVEMSLMGLRSPGFGDLLERERIVRAGEQIRTLYVALTRARERVVTTGAWPTRSEATPERAASYGELMAGRSRLADLLAQWHQSSVQEQGEHLRTDSFRHTDELEAAWRWCAVATWPPPGESARRETQVDCAADPASAATRAATRREEARRASAERMKRPLLQTPSGATHADDESFAPPPPPEGVEGERPPSPDAPLLLHKGGRKAAMAAGTWVHRALEGWQPGAPAASELARWTATLDAWAESDAELTPQQRGDAIAAARALLDVFAHGELARRLASVRILGRELPFVATTGGSDAATPVGAMAGAMDLLFAEPHTGEIVVADFKTDVVPPESVEARAEHYRTQGEAYVAAVAKALGLVETSRLRFELWFIAADRVVSLDFCIGRQPLAS